jgi:hypothetical protein
MKASNRIVAVACVLGVLAVSPVYGEKVDNPLYKNWAQFKPGSYVVMKMVTTAAGNKTEMTQTQTLKECTPEKAVVEVKVVMMVSGQKIEQPPTAIEIAAKVPEGKVEAAEKDPDTEVENGAEEIEVGGGKFKAEWTETKSKQGEAVTTTKVWTSDEVPGQQLKMKSTMPGGMTVESELIEFKAEKK